MSLEIIEKRECRVRTVVDAYDDKFGVKTATIILRSSDEILSLDEIEQREEETPILFDRTDKRTILSVRKEIRLPLAQDFQNDERHLLLFDDLDKIGSQSVRD